MTVRECDLPMVDGPLSPAAAAAWIPRTCFKNGPPARVGVELEVLVHDAQAPDRDTSGPDFDTLRAASVELPVTGRVTVEPGGQLEISSAPADSLVAALTATLGDLELLRATASAHGAALVGAGVDDRPAPRRVLDHPRYAAMEAYLDTWGPAARMMMRSTASVQINLEAAGEGEGTAGWSRRWELLHAVGPALVAAFATSPGRRGPWAGWASARQAVWSSLDPARTCEPVLVPGEPLPHAWARWCLDAPLMMVRRDQGSWTAPRGATFRDWIQAGRSLVPDRPGPTVDDLEYHLTTVFPPVRARGHFEVRYVDSQPGDWWQVPVSVLSALVTDPTAGTRALVACRGLRGLWPAACRDGLRDPRLALAARDVLEAAAVALSGDPATAVAAPAVEAYREHWTERGRSPGDDLRDGRPLPVAPLAARRPAPPAAPEAGTSLELTW